MWIKSDYYAFYYALRHCRTVHRCEVNRRSLRAKEVNIINKAGGTIFTAVVPSLRKPLTYNMFLKVNFKGEACETP